MSEKIINKLLYLKEYDNLKNELYKVDKKYPFKINDYYKSLIEEYSSNDPIYLQSIPSIKELESNYSPDPFKEKENQKIKHLIHRYPNRAVLLTNNICEVNCRHCMRKRLWGEKKYILRRDELDNVIDYIKENNLEDIILSGGDPLNLDTEFLNEIMFKINEIDSVRLIRIGTRIPTVAPYKIGKKLLNILGKYNNLFLLTHFNHFKEITKIVREKINMLKNTGITLLNQSVLLKGVNDSSFILKKLNNGLISMGVKPYYLHQCDLVKGVAHFWVPIEKGIKILKKLQGNISGIALPHYAVDLPGGMGKVVLGPETKLMKQDGFYIFRNYQNKFIKYPDLKNFVS